jgi:hypothetical protein
LIRKSARSHPHQEIQPKRLNPVLPAYIREREREGEREIERAGKRENGGEEKERV